MVGGQVDHSRRLSGKHEAGPGFTDVAFGAVLGAMLLKVYHDTFFWNHP